MMGMSDEDGDKDATESEESAVSSRLLLMMSLYQNQNFHRQHLGS